VRIEERIGARLREERRKKGWSQEVLGEQVSHYLGRPWSAQTVSTAEAGGRDFDAEDMVVLSLVFGLPVAAFYRQAVEATEEISLPSGFVVKEEQMRKVYGLPNQEAHRLAGELRKLSADVALLGEGES
jgi:transcriptional regulator with XRE-family HTH domain